jgi:nucleotide-binding universal stress UspA family protein
MRVLLASDGSTDADVAVRWLDHLPLPQDREVMVITVVPSRAPGWPGTSDVREGQTAMEAMQARRVADDTASRVLRTRSIGRVVQGDPGTEIVNSARDWEADLLVLGTRDLGWIEAFFRGSVSRGVVRNAPCPVLVCKGGPRNVQTVTVALDGSPHARQALGWLAHLPLTTSMKVRLLSVLDHDLSIASEQRDRLEAELGRAAEVIESLGIAVEATLTTGVPGTRIVEESELHGADLVVVGARGIGGAARLVLGSVSEAVLAQARCPVLVVRAATGDSLNVERVSRPE